MYSVKRLDDIWSLELFLGIVPGERWPRPRIPEHPVEPEDEGELVFTWRYDPELQRVIYTYPPKESADESVPSL